MNTVFMNCLNFCEVYGRIPYFWELLETLNAHKISFSILGNPFHIDDKTCRKLKALGCEKYQLSIDGMKDTHDFFRKPGSFDETLCKIKAINDAGICSVIMSTVSGLNIHEIPDVIDFLRLCDTKFRKSARHILTARITCGRSMNTRRGSSESRNMRNRERFTAAVTAGMHTSLYSPQETFMPAEEFKGAG